MYYAHIGPEIYYRVQKGQVKPDNKHNVNTLKHVVN